MSGGPPGPAVLPALPASARVFTQYSIPPSAVYIRTHPSHTSGYGSASGPVFGLNNPTLSPCMQRQFGNAEHNQLGKWTNGDDVLGK
jgi:hypothetical protein